MSPIAKCIKQFKARSVKRSKNITWNKKIYRVEVLGSGLMRDTEPLNALIRDMQPCVKHLSGQIRNQFNTVDCEDILQIMNMFILKGLAKFDPNRAQWNTFFYSFIPLHVKNFLSQIKSPYRLHNILNETDYAELKLEEKNGYKQEDVDNE
jgi:hypothetical protein